MNPPGWKKYYLVKFELSTAFVLKTLLFWYVTLRRWIEVAHLFQERSDSAFRDLVERSNSFLEISTHEDGGTMFLRNV
jgi:hypothetical protein